MRFSFAAREEAGGRLPWSFPPWLLPLWAIGVGWQWWKLGVRQLETAYAGMPGPAAWAGLATVLARFAGFLIESGAYLLLWAIFGLRLRFWRFASWLLSISMLEVAAEAMRLDLMARGGAQLRDAILLGPIVLHGPHQTATGPLAAFGALGVTTALRIGWSAKLQAQDLGLRWIGPLVATVTVWTLCRCAVWMAAELLAGRSAAR